MAKEGFLGNLTTVKIKSRLVRLAFALEAEKIMKEGILDWVKTAENIIPVYQGEARGSIQVAADLVDYTVKDWGKVFNTAARDNRPATWQKGKDASEADLQINRLKGEFLFTWKTTVYHLEVNEQENVAAEMAAKNRTTYGLLQPGPYHFRDSANEAFRKSLERSIKTFPFASIVGRNLEVKAVKLQ